MDAVVGRVDGAPRRARPRRPAAAGPRRPARRRRRRDARAIAAWWCRTPTAPRPSSSEGWRCSPRSTSPRWRRGTAPTSRSPTRSPVALPDDEREPESERWISRRSSVSARPSRRSSSPRRAAITCSCAGRPARARRCSRGGSPASCPHLDDGAALDERLDPQPRRMPAWSTLSRTPPFEAPHHSASVAALVGGGSRFMRPGRDRARERGRPVPRRGRRVPASALDALRQPLESGTITIHRARRPAQFPARFQLVLATNPCPCGDYGIRGGTCTCPPAAIRRYLGRLSGPLLDRMDIELTLTRVSVAQRDSAARGGHDGRRARPRRRGPGARRAAGSPARPGGSTPSVPGTWLRDGPGAPPPLVRRPLDAALHRGALTLRGYDRVLRVAWSLADLDGRAAAQRRPHRPRALPEEGTRPVTAFDLSADAARPRARRRQARRRRRRCRAVERYATVVWSQLTEPGDGVAGRLIARSGAAPALEAVLAEGDAARASPPSELGGGPQALDAAAVGTRGRRLARDGRGARACTLVTRSDPQWPRQLDDLDAHAPLCLWVRGDVAALRAARSLRRPRRRAGRHVATATTWRWSSRPTSPAAASRSSRAARTASTAPRTARRSPSAGSTVALLAGGADRAYPAGHTQLIDRIAERGSGGERGAVRLGADEVALPAAQPADRRALRPRRWSSRPAGAAARSTPPATPRRCRAAARRRPRSDHERRPPPARIACSASSARSASRAPPTCASCSGSDAAAAMPMAAATTAAAHRRCDARAAMR